MSAGDRAFRSATRAGRPGAVEVDHGAAGPPAAMRSAGPDADEPRRVDASGRQAPLTAPSRVAALLKRHGLTPDRGFSQNFLVDAGALAVIVDAAEVQPTDTVFEVGPGLGVLTRELASRAARVVSVELDRRLQGVLAETLSGLGSVELVFGDAARYDFASLPEGTLLVANLPYGVATAVVTRALASRRFRRLVFLVQREVADRLTAAPGTPAYGSLTLLVRHFGRAASLRRVPPGAFLPAPKVTSAVVRIDVDRAARPDPELFRFIRLGFAHRRKTLAKNLALAGFDREAVNRALAELGLDGRVRAEALELTSFERLLASLAGGTDWP